MSCARTAIATALLANLLWLGACSLPAAAPGVPAALTVTARLAGASEVPPLAGAGSGTVEGLMNGQTRALPWTVSYADLMAGKWYVNLHTAANPNGEVRGQVAVLQ